MSPGFTESIVEDAALAWLAALGYTVLHGPDIAVGEPNAERSDPAYRDVTLAGRLRQALVRLNPELPHEALEEAHRKLLRSDAPSLVARNRALHRMLVDGVPVEYRRRDGSIGGTQVRVIDFTAPDNNDWLAVNQFTVAEGQHTRRPDVVLFVNGPPFSNCKPTRRRSRRSLSPTRSWSPRMACRRASVRWGPAKSGSSPGAPSPGARTPRPH
jgi:type I restriction enzyme R subunit